MLPVFWLVLVLVGSCVLLVMLGLWGQSLYNHYRGGRAVICPETHRQVGVRFDALRAAASELRGRPLFRLADCTRWPQRADCGQDCIPQALEAPTYTEGEAELPKTKKIYHLPVLLAAFAAWVLGALWHSQYLLRPSWTQALGLSPADLHRIVRWWTPHVLSVAACLLFAYGAAWLIVWRGLKGAGRGIIASLSLWLAVAAASLLATNWTELPKDLLRIEATYTLLASVIVGAIIGGLSGKLREPPVEQK
ncbi:MAG TPA: DUF1761 domain-containing protein [Terriglobales bacterium]|jgi:hypothetical protein|nr:DUF1761 domain-containing protein [Terriglobales bacterium]